MTINRNALKSYAPKARREFIAAVTARAAKLGISKSKTVPTQEQGDLVVIGADAYPKRIGQQRHKLLNRIALHGFEQTMEEIAYTWFNRLLAIRFMELHGYLDHGYRVLSHPSGKALPEILEHAEHLDFPGLNRSKVVDLKLDGTKDAELYQLLLIAQCNALHRAMPFLFEVIDDETELLLPDNLLHSDSLIRKLVTSIEEADWQEIEIVGWLYQFYISEKKDQVIGKVVKSEDIPAATQLFTPNWIVKYMVQNSLGAQWLATYPDSALKVQMEYYIEPAEQTEEVQRQLAAITPKELNPEELTLIDPACGSGHILVEAYNLFKAIYLERGYPLRDVPRLILEKNLYGLDIDDRAAQMAGFALLMRARADDRRILSPDNPPLTHVMAIQDSKDLDANKIARTLLPKSRFELVPSSDLLPDTLAQPVLSAERPSEVKAWTIKSLVDLFAEAKTFGSLITVPEDIAKALPLLQSFVLPTKTDDIFQREAKQSLRPLVEQGLLLARHYDAVVANPPYMGSKYQNGTLKAFLKHNFGDAAQDTYTSFIDRSRIFTRGNGLFSLITLPSWMAIPAFEAFRYRIFDQSVIRNFIENGRGVWGPDYGSCAFTFLNCEVVDYKGQYQKLFERRGEVNRNATIMANFFRKEFIAVSLRELTKVPGVPIAYWVSNKMRSLFEQERSVSSIGDAKNGMTTGDNDSFLRFWFEVSNKRIDFSRGRSEAGVDSTGKWVPYSKGGEFRKWYGNADLVVLWGSDGEALRANKPKTVLRNPQYYFREALTWSLTSMLGFGARYRPAGFAFDVNGMSLFCREANSLYVLGFLNSVVCKQLLEIINPTIAFQAGDIARLPIKTELPKVREISRQCVDIAKADWDSVEGSWDFATNPVVLSSRSQPTLEASFGNWQRLCTERRNNMKGLEEENNRIFIDAHGLENEFSETVPDEQITLMVADRHEDVRNLISYAVGCMMGRYSLAEPGLIYAHAGNEGFDPSRYGEFPAEDDGIVPITEFEWFDDDAAVRFEEFLKVAWSPETLRENLRCVAESLATNGGSDPQKTIRSYFAKTFFKDHLKTYEKRPIYWLFSSGKLKAFECLVYLHRYNESTLSRMRMEYVTPLQSRMAARIDQLTDEIASASSSAARTKAQKEKDLLVRQLEELRAFDEELRHYADQRIALDLDDGVKVNYGKFGSLLAEKDAIVGKQSGDDE